jgi:hypothetical protein
VLTDRQWEHIATEIMHAVGLAPHGDIDAVRWIAIRHADNPVHTTDSTTSHPRRPAAVPDQPSCTRPTGTTTTKFPATSSASRYALPQRRQPACATSQPAASRQPYASGYAPTAPAPTRPPATPSRCPATTPPPRGHLVRWRPARRRPDPAQAAPPPLETRTETAAPVMSNQTPPGWPRPLPKQGQYR